MDNNLPPFKIFSGTKSRYLAEAICEELGVEHNLGGQTLESNRALRLQEHGIGRRCQMIGALGVAVGKGIDELARLLEISQCLAQFLRGGKADAGTIVMQINTLNPVIVLGGTDAFDIIVQTHRRREIGRVHEIEIVEIGLLRLVGNRLVEVDPQDGIVLDRLRSGRTAGSEHGADRANRHKEHDQGNDKHPDDRSKKVLEKGFHIFRF